MADRKAITRMATRGLIRREEASVARVSSPHRFWLGARQAVRFFHDQKAAIGD
jgi:hypothetical protein